MGKKLTIFTENGRSDSLSQSVRIAFTLTPCPSQFKKDATYYPIAQMVMDFRANDEQSQTFKWDTELGFSLWSRKTEHSIRVESSYCSVPPTHYVELRASPRNDPPRWSRTQPSDDPVCRKELFVTAVNRTNQDRLLTLGCVKQTFDKLNLGFHSFEPLVCYNIAPGYSAFAPSHLMLQAYVVNGVKSKRNQLLLDEHLKYPIFPEPISCDTLPKASLWRLSRDNKGVISLTNQDKNEFDLLAAQAQIEKINESLGTTEAQLSKVDERLRSLESSQREAAEARAATKLHPLSPPVTPLQRNDSGGYVGRSPATPQFRSSPGPAPASTPSPVPPPTPSANNRAARRFF